jgi:hypothetical protein
MPANESECSWSLETGQLWKVEDAYISILQVGERTAHYKLLNAPDQKSALTRLINIEALLKYMRQNQASLIANSLQKGEAGGLKCA